MIDSLEIIADLMNCLSLPCGHFINIQICSKTSYQVSVFETVGPLVIVIAKSTKTSYVAR